MPEQQPEILVRAEWTFLQTLLAIYVAAPTVDLFSTSFAKAAIASAFAAALSVIKTWIVQRRGAKA